MKAPNRPKRFVVIPAADATPLRLQSIHLLQALGPQSRVRVAAPAALSKAMRSHGFQIRMRREKNPVSMALTRAGAALEVVKTSPSDGAVLVQGAKNMAQVVALAPEGAKVFVEQWYRLERPPARPWRKQSTTLKKPKVNAATAVTWTITVKADGQPARALKDAVVTVMTDEAKGVGLEVKTDRYGRASFALGKHTKQVEAVYVEPLHGGWPVALPLVDVAPGGLLVKVPPIDLGAPDVRGKIYDKPPANAGKGVVVGIIDTGVGRHDNLNVVDGMNVTGEGKKRFRDEDGHGTHVAGVIASSAAGWRRGEASKVELRAYRIFKSGEEFASTFDIATAIKQAAADGCDLINLSVGGPEDGTVKDAIDLAWEAGCVCVAATGNDGLDEIDYPARYPYCVAVSAIGLETSWPAGTFVDWTLSKAKGKVIAGLKSFFASFSNRGPQVALSAPGVAVVSTIFDNRWGMMNGTSMATPIATGVLARRLAESLVLKMDRTATRSEAIAELARKHAEDLGFTANRQGKGLAR